MPLEAPPQPNAPHTLPSSSLRPPIKQTAEHTEEHMVVFGFSLADPKLDVCEEIFNQYANPNKETLPADRIKKRFIMMDDLRKASKSGAFPYLVKDRDGNIKFLKIFPAITKSLTSKSVLTDQTFLEIFHTCVVAKLNISADLPDTIMSSIFFPKVYEFGFLKTSDPFAKNDQPGPMAFPYLLSEAIDNITLTELAKKPKKAKKLLGFDIYSAGPLVIESILLQIIVALKNANLAWDLTHNDLHTGNIILSSKEKANFYIDFDNKRMQLTGPLVKIIDFGLAKSYRYPHNKGIWVEQRPIIKELDDFISEFQRPTDISLTSYLNIYRISENQDIRMFNLIMLALEPILKRRHFTLRTEKYCKDYDDCLRILSKWWP